MKKKEDYSWLLILSFFFLASLFTLHFETFLTWDASRHLYGILEKGSFRVVGNRFSITLFQFPVVALIKISSNFSLWYYKKAYGLLYSFIPFLVVYWSWVKLRSKSLESFYFISTSMGIAFILQQTHFLGEHLISCQLFFLLMCFLDASSFKDKIIELLLCLFLLFLHPVACYLLVLYASFKVFLGNEKVNGKFSFFIFLIVLLRTILFFFMTNEAKVLRYGFFKVLDLHLLKFPILYRDIPLTMVLLIYLFSLMICFRSKFGNVLWSILTLFFVSYFFWRSSDKHSTLYILKARNLIFIGSTPLFFAYLYLKKANSFLDRNLKNYAVVTSFLFFLIISNEGYKYRRSLVELNQAILDVGKVCISTRNPYLVNPLSRPWTHWASFYEYVMFKGRKDISTILIQGGSCEERKHPHDLTWSTGKVTSIRSGRYFSFNF